MNKPREEEKEIDRKLYKILGYEKCSEADQAIEKIKDLLSSQLKEVVGIIERARPVDNGTVRYHESYNDGKRDLADEVKAEVEKLA